MRKIIIENVDLMTDEEEAMLKKAIADQNVEFYEVDHHGNR